MSLCRRLKIYLDSASCTKFMSKWIKHFSIKPDSMNLIVEKGWGSHEHIGTGDNFLNRTPIVFH